jgi:hypothetical protein
VWTNVCLLFVIKFKNTILAKKIYFIKARKTPTYGSNLLMVIKSGLMNPSSKLGIYAPDPEAYLVFADLFDPVIGEYHLGFKPSDHQPPLDWSPDTDLPPIDPSHDFIISTR